MEELFKIGDTVKFLNETGGGVVRRIIDPTMVLVETEDGFEVPYLTSELLHTYKDHTEHIEKQPVKKEHQDKEGPGEPPRIRKEEKSKTETEFLGENEIDLHIEKIVHNPEVFSQSEIVDIQLARFEIALEGAVRAKEKKIIFIHGRGSGKLKHRIRKLLEEKYPRCTYQDASFKEYGYGATLVLINT